MSSLLVIPQTAFVSFILVYIMNGVLSTGFKALVLGYTAAIPIPLQFKSIVANTVSSVTVPVLSFAAFVAIQQVAELLVAVPYLMSSISELEAGPQSADAISEKNKIIVARQTLVRTSIFLGVAALVTIHSIKPPSIPIPHF